MSDPPPPPAAGAPEKAPRKTKKKKKAGWYAQVMSDLKKPSQTDEERKEAFKAELAARPKATFSKVEEI